MGEIMSSDVVIVYPLNTDNRHIVAADFRPSLESDSRLELFTKDSLLRPDLVTTIDGDVSSATPELRNLIEKAARRSVMSRLRTLRPEIGKGFQVVTIFISTDPSFMFGPHVAQLLDSINNNRLDPDRIRSVFREIGRADDRRNLAALLGENKYYADLILRRKVS